MKKCSFIIFSFLFLSVFSQAQYYWIQEAGGAGQDEGYDISVDAGNNAYTTGYFSGTATFRNYVGSISIASNGVTDIFVSKNNSSGQYSWVVKAGGPNVDRGLSIKADSAGNVYVTGFFTGTASFGTTLISSIGFQDMFVAKYNTNGILQWVRSGGGPQNDAGNGIDVDHNGNVYVTGQFIGTAQFGAYTLVSQVDSLTMLSSIDIFTLKYDSTGNIQWAKRGSSKYTDRGLDIGCDPSGNVYVTGQFSDTVTFDNVHNNNMYNAIFLIKYNSSGTEQWFRRIGGGIQNIANGIAVNSNSDVYLTGDFTGNLIFFDSINSTLSSPYPERIFVAKYNQNGNLIWTHADGSDGDVSSKSIALDDSSNVFITGTFKCKLSQYANIYGQGTFNSVGHNDIFVSKYNSTGTWQWARNYGGQFDDHAGGIAVNHSYQPLITGGYQHMLDIPRTNHFVNTTTAYNGNSNDTYHINCGDSIINFLGTHFFTMRSIGAYDIFILNSFDLKAKPFYYYNNLNDSLLCQKPYVGISICAGNSNTDNNFGSDTLQFCSPNYIMVQTQTSRSGLINLISPGPLFNYLWSTGETTKSILISTSGTYWVQATTFDGCFTSADTVYVIIHSLPPRPLISDSKGINVSASITQLVDLCIPDSVTLTVTNAGANSVRWTYLGSILPSTYYNFYNDSIVYTPNLPHSFNPNLITVYYIDSVGCSNFNNIQISSDSGIININPKMWVADSIKICQAQSFGAYAYDSISNPLGSYSCNLPYASFNWVVSPSMSHTDDTNCNNAQREIFYPSITGTYSVICQINRQSPCGGIDSFTIVKTVYVEVDPIPIVNQPTITGITVVCPGDTITLAVNGSGYINWTGPGLSSQRHDSIVEVTQPGHYSVTVSDTNMYGCYNSDNTSVNVTSTSLPAITITPSSGLICPNDSVQLTVAGNGIYNWEGPFGPIGGNSQTVYATTPGYYYCVVASGNCQLSSNIIQLRQYATPYLTASPNTVMCPGNSVQIDVVTSSGSIVHWDSPLSGSSLSQVVNVAGLYTCDVTSCGILTQASVTIIPSLVSASISPTGPIQFCSGDSVILTANGGMVMYQWSPVISLNPAITVYQAGIYSVQTTDGYGCTATSSHVIVNVDSGVSAPIVSGNSPLCAGDTLLLNSNSVANVNYNWVGPNGFLSTLTNPVIYNSSVNNSGTYLLTLTAVNGCTNNSSVTVVVDSSPPLPVITTNSPLCAGDTLRLGSSLISGASYNWTGPNGFLSALINPVLPNSSVSDSGIFFLVTTYSNGCSKASSVIVVIDSSVAAPVISSNSPLCDADTLTLNSNFILGVTYTWTGPAGYTSSQTNPVIQNASIDNSGIYRLTLTPGNGCSNSSELLVIIDSLPKVKINADTHVCIDSLAVLSSANVLDALFDWTGPNGFSANTNYATILSYQMQDAGWYHLTVSKGSCTSSDSVELITDDCLTLIIPNVFTPNGDGQNDFFEISNYDIEKINCKIYNRWGILIYEWDNPAGKWDGSDSRTGVKALEGVYYYLISLKAANKEVEIFHGNVQLIRN